MKEPETEILRSRILLKPEFRKPFQTTKFIYRALEVAETQAVELYEENLKLKEELEKLYTATNHEKIVI